MCLQCYLHVLNACNPIYVGTVLFMSVQCHLCAHSAACVRTVIFMSLQCYLRALYVHSIIYVRAVLFGHRCMIFYVQ